MNSESLIEKVEGLLLEVEVFDNFDSPVQLKRRRSASEDRLTRLQSVENQQQSVLLTNLANLSSELVEKYSVEMERGISAELQERARAALNRLVIDRLVDTLHGLDYALELRLREILVSSDRNSLLYWALISIAGYRDDLKRENHGLGYHFHYIKTRPHLQRTDLLLTFDPAEPVGPPDTLHWQHHSSHIRADPDRWAEQRRRAVHSATRPSTIRPGKIHFLRPGKEAKPLWWE